MYTYTMYFLGVLAFMMSFMDFLKITCIDAKIYRYCNTLIFGRREGLGERRAIQTMIPVLAPLAQLRLKSVTSRSQSLKNTLPCDLFWPGFELSELEILCILRAVHF